MINRPQPLLVPIPQRWVATPDSTLKDSAIHFRGLPATALDWVFSAEANLEVWARQGVERARLWEDRLLEAVALGAEAVRLKVVLEEEMLVVVSQEEVSHKEGLVALFHKEEVEVHRFSALKVEEEALVAKWDNSVAIHKRNPLMERVGCLAGDSAAADHLVHLVETRLLDSRNFHHPAAADFTFNSDKK